MSRDHPFSQRNRTTERTMGVEVGGDREVGGGGGGQNLKKGGWTKFENGGWGLGVLG